MMFDGRSLVQLLRDAGFKRAAVSSYKASAIPEIDQIELEVRRNESLYVEASQKGPYSIGSTTTDSPVAVAPRPGNCTITIAASTSTIPSVCMVRSPSPSNPAASRIENTG